MDEDHILDELLFQLSEVLFNESMEVQSQFRQRGHSSLQYGENIARILHQILTPTDTLNLLNHSRCFSDINPRFFLN